MRGWVGGWAEQVGAATPLCARRPTILNKPTGIYCLQERGFNAIELEKVRDGWVRDVGVVNADNGVLVTSCTAVTVEVRCAALLVCGGLGCNCRDRRGW